MPENKITHYLMAHLSTTIPKLLVFYVKALIPFYIYKYNLGLGSITGFCSVRELSLILSIFCKCKNVFIHFRGFKVKIPILFIR